MESCVFFLCLSRLQNSTLTIEEFHSKLQEATNFPLRPFVIPFLKVDMFKYASTEREGCLFVWSAQSGKHLASTDSRCAYLCSRYLFPAPLFAVRFCQPPPRLFISCSSHIFSAVDTSLSPHPPVSECLMLLPLATLLKVDLSDPAFAWKWLLGFIKNRMSVVLAPRTKYPFIPSSSSYFSFACFVIIFLIPTKPHFQPFAWFITGGKGTLLSIRALPSAHSSRAALFQSKRHISHLYYSVAETNEGGGIISICLHKAKNRHLCVLCVRSVHVVLFLLHILKAKAVWRWDLVAAVWFV